MSKEAEELPVKAMQYTDSINYDFKKLVIHNAEGKNPVFSKIEIWELMQAYADKVKLEHTIEALEDILKEVDDNNSAEDLITKEIECLEQLKTK